MGPCEPCKPILWEADVTPRPIHNDEYAEAHGLVYAWEGTRSFEKRSRTLSPEQFQIVTAHTRRRGVTRVMLFSKDILKAEFEADRPRRDALAAKRDQWQGQR
jgi:hypothetical protein